MGLKVSVAIPCYNAASSIGPTIEAALAQSRPADEVLVIDDGSTDASADVVRQYPATLVSHPENRGLSAARNTAMDAASGDILLFIDADAIAAPDLIDTLLSAYAVHDSRLGGVGGQGVEANMRSAADRWRRAHATQGYGARTKYVPHLSGLCMSYRVSALRQIGGFDVVFRTNAEDVDVGLRLTSTGFRLLYLPGARVFHQRSDDIASLGRTMAAWYSAAYQARRKNRAQSWTLFVGTLRRIITDPLKDVLVVRDPTLIRLSLRMCRIKLTALWQARRSYQD